MIDQAADLALAFDEGHGGQEVELQTDGDPARVPALVRFGGLDDPEGGLVADRGRCWVRGSDLAAAGVAEPVRGRTVTLNPDGAAEVWRILDAHRRALVWELELGRHARGRA